jgi:glycosyltransferase involved in cell wall biosynthesis
VFDTFVPSKLFDAMACARPVLLSVDGEARALLERSRAGWYVQPGAPEALADAVRGLAADPQACRDMGACGRAFVSDGFSREGQAARFAAVVERAAGERT